MQFVYRVPALFPLNNKDCSLGCYAFDTMLSMDFAIKARQAKIESFGFFEKNMQESALRVIKLSGMGGITEPIRPYHFIKDSLLLQFVEVPGNATDLGLCDFEDFYDSKRFNEMVEYRKEHLSEFDFVRYGSHNVDSLKQAQMLLALWVDWANKTDTLINRSRL